MKFQVIKKQWILDQNNRVIFTKELQGAHTVVWNGPMGVFEFSNLLKVQSVYVKQLLT